MIAVPAGVRVMVATKPVDFRRGADGLVALVRETLGQDPFAGTIFVFRSKRADRVKIVAWDGSGLVLFWKRLEHGTFRWPPISRRYDAANISATRCISRRHGLVASARTRCDPDRPQRRESCDLLNQVANYASQRNTNLIQIAGMPIDAPPKRS